MKTASQQLQFPQNVKEKMIFLAPGYVLITYLLALNHLPTEESLHF